MLQYESFALAVGWQTLPPATPPKIAFLVLETLAFCRWIYANPRFVRDSAADEQAEALDYTHMGMLAILPNNELVAAWQARISSRIPAQHT